MYGRPYNKKSFYKVSVATFKHFVSPYILSTVLELTHVPHVVDDIMVVGN